MPRLRATGQENRNPINYTSRRWRKFVFCRCAANVCLYFRAFCDAFAAVVNFDTNIYHIANQNWYICRNTDSRRTAQLCRTGLHYRNHSITSSSVLTHLSYNILRCKNVMHFLERRTRLTRYLYLKRFFLFRRFRLSIIKEGQEKHLNASRFNLQ